MLQPPSKGFAYSVNKHNGELDAFAEWIEGCITFVDEQISKIDIVDALIESNLYSDQDFAKEWITDGWQELSHRKRCLGDACSFVLHDNRIEAARAWSKTPAFSFCLMVSLQASYRKSFRDMFGSDYTEQGSLFERLTAESMEAIGWKTHGTGWSKAAANSIRDKVESLARHLGEECLPGSIGKWADAHAKDGGLDVVCHQPFPDQWGGRPLLFVQCATSSEEWQAKRATPNIRLWEKLLDMSTRPTRGISIPFALMMDDFRRAAVHDDLSLILDRHRLCTPKHDLPANWLSKPLAKELNEWTRSRLPALLESKAS